MKSMIKNLTEKKVGHVVEVQTDEQGAGNFVRARVRLDVITPLARFFSISRGGQREIFARKFEKIQGFVVLVVWLGTLIWSAVLVNMMRRIRSGESF
jgi:hypothetical protein